MQYISKSRIKTKYGLTDGEIAQLGKADLLVDNPHGKRAPQMKLYLIKRVEKWISARDVPPKPKAEPPPSQPEISRLAKSLVMREAPDREELVEIVEKYLRMKGHTGQVTERILFSFLCQNYTSMGRIMEYVKSRGDEELYENLKVYFACKVIDNYELDIDPLYAIYGQVARDGNVPERFRVHRRVEHNDLETALEKLLGIEKMSRYLFEYSERNVRKMVRQIVG